MSTTPRTDALLKVGTNAEQLCEALDRSRQLETELIALQEENQRLIRFHKEDIRVTNESSTFHMQRSAELEKERDNLLATVEGLRHVIERTLLSATPNEENHPTMFGAWESMKQALQSLPPTNLVKRSALENLYKVAILFTEHPSFNCDFQIVLKEAQEELQRTKPL